MFVLWRAVAVICEMSMRCDSRGKTGVLTLIIHLVGLAVWRCRVARVHLMAAAVLGQLLHAARGSALVLTRHLRAWLVGNRRQLDGSRVAGWRLSAVWTLLRGVGLLLRGARTLLVGLARVLLLLLACLPLLTDLLEFCYTGTTLVYAR